MFGKSYSEVELRELSERIQALKLERDAILLAHNYQRPEIQALADYIGDSFGLSQLAAKSDAEVIIFCGVDFMAESAKILAPDKIVIHPEPKASCPMAKMVDSKKLKALKQKYPNALTVAYVNTKAETKAEVDLCCTSANALKVIKNADADEIIFIPDKHLAEWVAEELPDKKIIYWEGYCWVHQDLIEAPIIEMLKSEHPNAEILVHPECIREVRKLADYILSTEGMVRRVKHSDATEFIIGTERELCHRLKTEYPNKIFYPIPNAICRAMKFITIDKVLTALEKLEPRVELPQSILEKARKPLELMLKLGRTSADDEDGGD